METWEAELQAKLGQDEPETPQDGPSASVALLLRWRDGPEGLLIHRIEREGDPWSGQIALPGGMRDIRDKSPVETARRETLEEVALDVGRSFFLLGRLPRVRPVNVSQLTVFPYVFSLRKEASPRAGPEVQEAFWTSLSSLRTSRTTRTVHAGGRELRVPVYLTNGRVVWGLTHRILTNLFDLSLGFL
ncbi:MAG: NUDIX hydrolase [Thermoplasmata archaeon]